MSKNFSDNVESRSDSEILQESMSMQSSETEQNHGDAENESDYLTPEEGRALLARVRAGAAAAIEKYLKTHPKIMDKVNQEK